jgi:formate dehydrogenase iron-sulfur subunit
LHRLRLLHDRLPVQHSEIQSSGAQSFKCTLCNDRVSVGLEPACIKACPTGCLHFGTKSEMKELAETRAAQLRDHSGFPMREFTIRPE